MDFYFFLIMPELELRGLQESPPQHLMLLINKAFFCFKSEMRKIRVFKGNFQKHVLFLSLGLLRHRCFSVGAATVLRVFNQMPSLMM